MKNFWLDRKKARTANPLDYNRKLAEALRKTFFKKKP